jgi:hypothetical protein
MQKLIISSLLLLLTACSSEDVIPLPIPKMVNFPNIYGRAAAPSIERFSCVTKLYNPDVGSINLSSNLGTVCNGEISRKTDKTLTSVIKCTDNRVGNVTISDDSSEKFGFGIIDNKGITFKCQDYKFGS